MDLAVLHARMGALLPRPSAYLSTPYMETVLLVERLGEAGVPIDRLHRRTFRAENGEHLSAVAIEMAGRQFSARSCQPWEDYARWHGAHQGRPVKWIDERVIEVGELNSAMVSMAGSYGSWRAETDAAIAAAISHGQATRLDALTRRPTKAADIVRL